MVKYLIDTCVWRDFYENKISKTGRKLGEHAAELFIKIIKNKDVIIYSEALLRELRTDYDEEEIYDMLFLLASIKLLIRIDITKGEHLEANRLSSERNIPYVDCLNAIQARNHNAIMISQDLHFLNELNDIVKTIRPS